MEGWGGFMGGFSGPPMGGPQYSFPPPGGCGGGYGLPAGGAMGGMAGSVLTPEDQELQKVVAESIQAVERARNKATQAQSTIIDYMGRTAKRVLASRKPWQERVSDFSYKFFETLWKAFGDCDWLDEVEFTGIMAAGLRVHVPKADLAHVPDEEFLEVVLKQTRLGYDCSRYYNWGSYVLKAVITGKATQKKVRNAMDDSREELLKMDFDTAENFVTTWIKATVDRLGNEAGHVLPQACAMQLFGQMIKSGGGVPLWLQQATSEESIKEATQTAISMIYAAIPSSGIGGKGAGFGAAMSFGGLGRPGPY